MPFLPPSSFSSGISSFSGSRWPLTATGTPASKVSVRTVGSSGALRGGVSQSQTSSGSSVSRPMPPEAIERHHIVLSSPPTSTSVTGTP